MIKISTTRSNTQHALVVDEDQTISDITVMMLEREGFDARPVHTLEEATLALREMASAPALVLVSANLAGKSRTALQALTNHEPRPTILMTCTRPSTCPLQSGDCCSSDMGCLTKPNDFTPSKFIARIGAFLESGIGCLQPAKP